MIIGIGTDIIEIDRISRAVTRKHFINRVFTDREKNYCEGRSKQAAASYAARFAGKEAFFKALGTGIVSRLIDIEILNDEAGCPHVTLHDRAAEIAVLRGVDAIHLSLSHSHDYATAICVLEKTRF